MRQFILLQHLFYFTSHKTTPVDKLLVNIKKNRLNLHERRYLQLCCLHTELQSATDRVEEVSHPLGNNERQHDGNTERDIASTFDHNHCQTKGHPCRSTKVRRRTDQCVLSYVRPLYTA